MNYLRFAGIRALIALLLASSLWAFVNFTDNPTQSRPFEDLPIGVENVPPGLVLVDEAGLPIEELPTSVDLVVAGPLDVFSRGVTRSSITPYINLADYASGTFNVPVQVRTAPAQLQVLRLSPETVPVRLEQEVTETMTLHLRVDGNPPFSYEAQGAVVSLNKRPIQQVLVRGPASQVERVNRALIEINIEGQTNTIISQRQPVPVDSNERAVAGVEVLPATVDVEIQIVSSAGVKRVPVLARWRGVPASGYALIRSTAEPPFVELVGASTNLESVNFVETEPVDISEMSDAFTQTMRLRIPPGVTLLNPDEGTVEVNVVIVPVDLSFSLALQIPVVPVNAPPGTSVIINPQLLTISVSGRTQALQALRSGDMEAVVDLQGLGPGSHQMQPALTLPPGLTIERGLQQVTVEIIPQATITPQPAPPQPATPVPAAPELPQATPTLPLSPTTTVTPTG